MNQTHSRESGFAVRERENEESGEEKPFWGVAVQWVAEKNGSGKMDAGCGKEL